MFQEDVCRFEPLCYSKTARSLMKIQGGIYNNISNFDVIYRCELIFYQLFPKTRKPVKFTTGYYATDGGEELFYQDALHFDYKSLTIFYLYSISIYLFYPW